MKTKITSNEALQAIHVACEYYDMVHDTGDKKQNKKDFDYVWKGYDRLVEILNENKSNK